MEKMRMETENLVEENIKKLMELFPSVVTETVEDGKVERAVDFDALKQELSDVVVEGNAERYQFTWPDKKKARLLANTPVRATLRPCKEESVDFDSTQNLYIEGDNLDVLKLLRETYLGKIKIIYIDPPYNTGNDFIYEDNFAMSSDEYMSVSGNYDDLGNRLTQNANSNGRFHTDWLNFIYPRIKVAKDLLAEDGIIFISIGEQEADNLKKLCSEIFGQRNFIENYIWESTFRPDNSSKILRRNAEYVLCFAKNISRIFELYGLSKTREGLPSLTKSNMKESTLTFPANVVKTYLADGTYTKGRRESYELLDDVVVREGVITNRFRLIGRMIWGQEHLEEEITNGTEIIIKSDGFVPYTKKPGNSEMSPTKIIPNSVVGDVLSANTEMTRLSMNKIFPYPKPVSLLKYLLNYVDDKNAYVLDFFSGSATTAHAVMQLNAEDDGNRKFIMVQLPEICREDSEAYRAGYKTICEIGKERIRRAGNKIKEDVGLLAQNLDTGFRVLKLDSSNMKDVYYKPDESSQQRIDEILSNVKEDRTPMDLLFQVMLEKGKPLSSKIDEKVVEGKTVYVVNDNDLICCFDNDIGDDVVKAISQMKPLYAVFRDSSFKSDDTMTNAEQYFRTYSPNTDLSII